MERRSRRDSGYRKKRHFEEVLFSFLPLHFLSKDQRSNKQHCACREGLFTRTGKDRANGNGFKLKEVGCRLAVRKKLFTVRVERLWNRLPRKPE